MHAHTRPPILSDHIKKQPAEVAKMNFQSVLNVKRRYVQAF